jgi:prevent-host-death family protein
MKTATITEVKNGLSALIDRVKAGETIVVTDRGIPVARIEPVTASIDVGGRLKALERAGIIRRATGKPPVDLIRQPGPAMPPGVSVVDALIGERRSDR